MNRYTFKAKRKDNGEWVYGYYLVNVYCDDCITYKEKLEEELNQTNQDIYYMIEVLIIKETLCQCTDVQDIDGNYIFENDIVLSSCIDIVGIDYEPNFEYEIVSKKGKIKTIKYWLEDIVIWNEKECGFKFKSLETNTESVHIECEHKIIGNKFDKESEIDIED